MPDRKPGADELYCSSCGEIIKKQAELCPNCGVPNKEAKQDKKRDFETTVSGDWWIGVAVGTALWIFLVLLASIDPVQGSLTGFLVLTAWIATPLAAYYDIQYVRANSDWNPDEGLWMLLLLLWIINIPAGIVYLVRRHEAVGTP